MAVVSVTAEVAAALTHQRIPAADVNSQLLTTLFGDGRECCCVCESEIQ